MQLRIRLPGLLATVFTTLCNTSLHAQFVHQAVNSFAGGSSVSLVAAGNGEVIGTNGPQTWRWDSLDPFGAWVATTAAPVPFNATSARSTTRGAGTATIWDGSQLFEWSGSQWVNVSWSGSPPSANVSFSIAGMPNGDILLFGGWNGAPSNETWLLDATNNWTQLFPSASPPGRTAPALAYDSTRGTVVMFGGGGSAAALGDTWEFDGSTWTQTSTGGPSARTAGALCYRQSTETMTLVGGLSGFPLTDAWNYVSGTWLPVTSTHTGDLSYCFSAALHPVTDEIIATGQSSSPVTVTVRLSGHVSVLSGCTCAGQSGPFTATGVGSTTIGMTFTLNLTNFEVGNPLWAIWDTAPIATPVQFPGLPLGCMANIASAPGSALVSASPQAMSAQNYFLAIPNNTALIGLRIVYQGLQLNLSSFLGCTSSAVDMRIGR